MSSNTTYFYGKNGQMTSFRTSTPLVSLTHPMDGGSGGVTFHHNGFTSRFSSSGHMGSSMKLGNYTTYFGSHGQMKDRLTPFTRRSD